MSPMEDELDDQTQDFRPPEEVFRSLLRMLPSASPFDYFKNGKWQVDLMLIDIELLEAHRTEAAAPEPPPLSEVTLPNDMPREFNGMASSRPISPGVIQPKILTLPIARSPISNGTIRYEPPAFPRSNSAPLPRAAGPISSKQAPLARPSGPLSTNRNQASLARPAGLLNLKPQAPLARQNGLLNSKQVQAPLARPAGLLREAPLPRTAPRLNSRPIQAPSTRPAVSSVSKPIPPGAVASSTLRARPTIPASSTYRPATATTPTPLSSRLSEAERAAVKRQMADQLSKITDFIELWGLEASKTKLCLARLPPTQRGFVLDTYAGDQTLPEYIEECNRDKWSALPQPEPLPEPTRNLKRPISAVSNGNYSEAAAKRPRQPQGPPPRSLPTGPVKRGAPTQSVRISDVKVTTAGVTRSIPAYKPAHRFPLPKAPGPIRPVSTTIIRREPISAYRPSSARPSGR